MLFTFGRRSVSDPRAYCLSSAVLGGTVWLLWITVVRPTPLQPAWAAALLLLNPLVLVPLGLRLIMSALPEENCLPWRLAVRLQPPAALLLVASFALPTGETAALLTLPWLAVTGLIAFTGLIHLAERGFGPLAEGCLDAGSVFLTVGGGWAVLSRWGIRPPDFEDIIVLLTAIHFHYAGFILPLLTGLAGRALGGKTVRLAAAGIVAGVPLVATGIVVTKLTALPVLECLASLLLAVSSCLVDWLFFRLAIQSGRPRVVRFLFVIAGLSLAGSMALAALYGLRAYLNVAWLDIPWMRALHGTANALGLGLPGLLAWSLDRPVQRQLP
jgi:hypothetical protein